MKLSASFRIKAGKYSDFSKLLYWVTCQRGPQFSHIPRARASTREKESDEERAGERQRQRARERERDEEREREKESARESNVA